jgi:hypothetical protein
MMCALLLFHIVGPVDLCEHAEWLAFAGGVICRGTQDSGLSQHHKDSQSEIVSLRTQLNLSAGPMIEL